MIHFTADLHLGHGNIIKYCHRPFKNVDEMDTILLRNLEGIKEKDTLYFLGDLSFDARLAGKFFDQLSGVTIYFLPGNHDSKQVIRLARERCQMVYSIMNIQIEWQPITLCHYAMRVWHKSHYNAWQLYAHSHGTLKPIGKQWDVGVDANGYKPVRFEELKGIMVGQPDNIDKVERRE